VQRNQAKNGISPPPRQKWRRQKQVQELRASDWQRKKKQKKDFCTIKELLKVPKKS
jgi:hypothetical protein